MFLERNGYRIVRFWNNGATENLDSVLQTIDSALRRGPHPDPLPQAGEGVGRAAAKQRLDTSARAADPRPCRGGLRAAARPR